MILKLVTFLVDDGCQFLVDTSSEILKDKHREKAIKEAIRVNKELGEYGDGTVMDNPDDYSVEDVDLDLLNTLFQSNNWQFKSGNVIAFQD